MHVLVVEDDVDVAAPLAHFFTARGFDAVVVARGRDAIAHVEGVSTDLVILDLIRGFDAAVVARGRDAIAHVEGVSTDLVILDLMLPDMDGIEVCSVLRDADFAGGLIMMSARDQEVDVVSGLDAGADDYLVKPCSIAELQSRVRSVLRRVERAYVLPEPPVGPRLEVRDFQVTYAGTEIATSGREYDVLVLLIAHRDRVVTHGELMDEVWGCDWSGSPMVLSSAISRIRERLAAAGAPDRVENVRGVGFRLTSSSGRPECPPS